MAKIPVILEAGRADGKLATSSTIFDENKGMFQSEINDIQDTLNSDNPNKPLSAKQGKVLKELLDAKVIESGAVPIDPKPIEGNTTHIVSSDGLAKEFNKCNTAKITTDRIEDSAVTSEKIATSAFDSTLSVSGKIAPADVVGEKLTKLENTSNVNSSNISRIKQDNKIKKTEEDGYYFVDENGNVAASHNSDGFDVNRLSSHFKSLIDITSSPFIFRNVIEEGVYICDINLNVITRITISGIESTNTLNYKFI